MTSKFALHLSFNVSSIGNVGNYPSSCSVAVVRESAQEEHCFVPSESVEVHSLDGVKRLRDVCDEVIKKYEDSQPKPVAEVKGQIK